MLKYQEKYWKYTSIFCIVFNLSSKLCLNWILDILITVLTVWLLYVTIWSGKQLPCFKIKVSKLFSSFLQGEKCPSHFHRAPQTAAFGTTSFVSRLNFEKRSQFYYMCSHTSLQLKRSLWGCYVLTKSQFRVPSRKSSTMRLCLILHQENIVWI